MPNANEPQLTRQRPFDFTRPPETRAGRRPRTTAFPFTPPTPHPVRCHPFYRMVSNADLMDV